MNDFIDTISTETSIYKVKIYPYSREIIYFKKIERIDK